MSSTPQRVQALLDAVSRWAAARPDLRAVALVGSYARGAAGTTSDVDLILITSAPSPYLQDSSWAALFGAVSRVARENYGKVTSLRVWYRDGLEVEYGITDDAWTSYPLDEGTRKVLLDGTRVLMERDQILTIAMARGMANGSLKGPQTGAWTDSDIDVQLRDAMFDYYDSCASEYDNAYTTGADTASPLDPSVFVSEARLLAGTVRDFASGRLIDIACGTAYWLPHYAPHCSSMTLLDQSERMLEQCRRRVDSLGLGARCAFVRGDFFDLELPSAAFDRVLVGFFLSHLSEAQEATLFGALRRLLSPAGRFLIMDSAFSPERARVNARIERQQRQLLDGRRFSVFKRYCGRDDIAGWAGRYGADLSLEHFGIGFFAVSGTFRRA